MQRRGKRIILIVVIILILVFLAGMLLPGILGTFATHESVWYAYHCANCGIQRSQRGTCRIGQPLTVETDTLTENPLSRWYREHYKEECQHNWRRYHFGATSYFQIGPFRYRTLMQSGGGPTPVLCGLNDDDRAVLEKLFADDPLRCRDYIRLRFRLRLFREEHESIINLSAAEMEALLKKLAEEEKLQESAQ